MTKDELGHWMGENSRVVIESVVDAAMEFGAEDGYGIASQLRASCLELRA